MQPDAVLLALLILGGTIAAAISGGRALMETPPDRWKLKLAAWMITVPWGIALLLGGDATGLVVADVFSGGFMIVSPLVTIGLLAGVWLRRARPKARETDTPTTAPTPVAVRPPMALTRRMALISELRFPAPAASAIALAVAMAVSWLFGAPRRGGGHYGGLAQMAWEWAMASSTLALSLLACVLALVFVARPTPTLAVTYSWMALAIVAGEVNLWALGYWREAADADYLHYALAPVLFWMGIAALTPAIVGHAIQIVLQLRGSGEPVWQARELDEPAFSATARFIWLVVFPAMPGLLLGAASIVFYLMMFVDIAPVQLGKAWTDAFYVVAQAGSLWRSVGLMAIVVLGGIGWMAIAKAGDAYRTQWKHVTFASFVAWLITAMVWP